MEAEDVIELGSSDEESNVPPRKKMKAVENAMVHIPTKIHGVTIKPVKVTPTSAQKLFSGKNITVTKLPTMPAQASGARQMKTPNKAVQKPLKGITKKVSLMSNIAQNRINPKVLNPVNHAKKMSSQTFVNCGVTRLQTPIPIASLPALNKLPPSVTVKKAGAMVKSPINLVNVAKVAPTNIKTVKKRKTPVVQTVELDDEEPQLQSSNCPQWYVRPEDQNNAAASATQEKINNKEPDKPTYIEITIEDSPIKPPKAKRTRELSVETVVTIEDSPNKDGATNADPDDGSDDEPNTSKKTPHSKKKLDYEKQLQRIDETHTVEIEIDPIAVNESIISATEKDDKIVNLTPNIVEVEESAVEIAEDQNGDVSVVIVEVEESAAETVQNPKEAESVVQVKPAQPKEVAAPSTIGNNDNENEFSSIYLTFINLCLRIENSDDMRKIVEKKIKTYYRQVPKSYTQSEEFIDLVSSKVSAIKAAPEKMYLYIKDIVDELHLQRKLAKQMPVVQEKPKEPETFSLARDGDFDPSKQRQIRKLEKTIKKLNRAIHKLETQEVDFDDDEDSVYLLTEKYKEKMVRVHAKFCQLTNSKMPSEPRLIIDPRPGLAPGPAKRLEQWINRNNTLTFPDFHDVLRCVKEANVEDKLEWTDAFIMEEARDLFIRCGKKLQRRRQEKEWRLATSRVTLTEDPADQSDELKKRLEDNRRLAGNKENEVINMFSDRQNQLKLEAVDINDKEAEESPEDSEEEENDESLSLESKDRRKDRLKRLLQEQSKKISKKSQLTETGINEKLESEVRPDGNKSDTACDDNSKQSLSDDESEIGSDVDELHLLQKLHSDYERRSGTSPESSDSETPIAISDTLDSSSEEGDKEMREKPCDIISIENSSYSDESDSQQSNAKKTERRPAIIEEIVEEVKERSSEMIAKASNDAVEDVVLTSPETVTNVSSSLPSENTKSGEDIHKSSEECLKERLKKTSDEDQNITSKSSELCNDANNISIPSLLEKKSGSEGVNSNTLDKNTDFQVTPIKNSDLVPELNLEALTTDSSIEDNSVNESTSKQSTDACQSVVNNKTHSDIPVDAPMEEPTVNSVSQAPTIDKSELSLTPLVEDSCVNTTHADVGSIESVEVSKSIPFDSNEILVASSSELSENDPCKVPSLGDETQSIEPMEGVMEGSAEIQIDNVCKDAEMESEILISNVMSIREPDLTADTLKENLNPNQDLDESMTLDASSQIISNGSSSEGTSDLLIPVAKSDTAGSDLQNNSVATDKPMAVDSVENKLEVMFDVKQME